MSDFFTNLVARTIAQPALRPRTRSRFEPAPESAGSFLPPPPARASEGEDAFAPAGEDGGVPSVRNVGVPAGWPGGVPPPQVAEVPAPLVREVIRNVIDQRVSREVERDVQRIVETNERVIRVPVVTREHRFDRQPPRVIERHLPREIEEVHRERETRTTLDRPPRTVRERSEAPSSPQQREPVIEVSIGRIEVRAVTSAPPPRKSTRNTTMTIDDYVAKRQAKERR